MADVGPLLRLYGVADSVFAEPPEGGVPPALESWLPLNAPPEAVGWYDRAREALGLDHTPEITADDPEITADNRVEVAREALDQIQAQQRSDDPLQPNHVLHAITAVARALPGAFEPDRPLREAGIAAVDATLHSLSHRPDEEGVAERVFDAFRTPEDNSVVPVEQWAAALNEAGLTHVPELQEPPCKDELTPAMTRRGEPTLAAKLTTEYDLDNVTLEDACSNFLNPGRWPGCAKGLWEQMSPCDGKGPITVNGVERQSFREVVQIDGVKIITCLTFSKVVSADECELAYDLCDEATAGSCAGGSIGGAVTVDHGYILVTSKTNGAGVHVKTVKTLRFRPPLDGVGAAMLACAIGYGPAGYAMAESCSEGDDNK